MESLVWLAILVLSVRLSTHMYVFLFVSKLYRRDCPYLYLCLSTVYSYISICLGIALLLCSNTNILYITLYDKSRVQFHSRCFVCSLTNENSFTVTIANTNLVKARLNTVE